MSPWHFLQTFISSGSNFLYFQSVCLLFLFPDLLSLVRIPEWCWLRVVRTDMFCSRSKGSDRYVHNSECSDHFTDIYICHLITFYTLCVQLIVCRYTSIKKKIKYIRCYWEELNFQLKTRQFKPPIAASFGPSPKSVRVSSLFCQDTFFLFIFSFACTPILPHFASLFKLVEIYPGKLSL